MRVLCMRACVHTRARRRAGAPHLLRRLRWRLLRRRLLVCTCDRARRRRRAACASPPLPPSTPPLPELSGPLAMSPDSPGSRTFSRYFCGCACRTPYSVRQMQRSHLAAHAALVHNQRAARQAGLRPSWPPADACQGFLYLLEVQGKMVTSQRADEP